MSSPPLNETISLQLHKRLGSELACRVDWGVGVGTVFHSPVQPAVGGSGARVDAGTLVVSAVVLYSTQTPCPPLVMR